MSTEVDPSSVFGPPQNFTASPDLRLLDEYRFQTFCADLWSMECRVAYVYGRRRQPQYGIDVFAYGRSDQGNGVGQCKRYQEFTINNLKTAITEFEPHIERWQGYGMVEFKMFIACACSDTKVLDEVHVVTERLKEKRVAFEFLDGDRIIAKLRRHRNLVAQYIGPQWVEGLCGPREVTVGMGENREHLIAASGLRDLVAEWETGRSRDLDDVREKFRRGEVFAAYNELRAYLRTPGWPQLSGEIKARALRVLASMELERGAGTTAARAWVEQARGADPQSNLQIIEALLAYEDGTSDDALRVLGEPLTVDAWNVQLSLWLTHGHSAKVLASIAAPQFPGNAETLRLEALAHLFQKDVAGADQASRASFAQKPDWAAMRHTRAMVQYVSTVSPHFHAWGHLTWPVPPERILIKRDDEALANVRAAAEGFERLLRQMPDEAPDRADVETWRLAALANDPTRDADAAAFASQLIAANPAHYRAIIWALERRYDFDRGAVRAALTNLVEDETVELDALLALVNLVALEGDHAGVRAFLEKYRVRFERAQVLSVWRFLMAQALTQLGEHDAAQALLTEETQLDFRRKTEAALVRLRSRTTHDAGPVADVLVRAYEETRKPEDLLDAAEACALAGRVEWVVEHAPALLAAFPTEGALRLVVHAAWQTKRFDVCLAWLETSRTIFAHARLPADLRRIEIVCLRELGRLQDAAERATLLVAEDGALENALERFQTQFALGDLPGCAHTARLLLGVAEMRPRPLLQAARVLAFAEKSLAIELWEAAMERAPLDDDSVLLAVDVAHRLGLESRTEGLMREVQRISSSGHRAVRQVGLDEMKTLLREQQETRNRVNRDYNFGVAPVHVISVMAGWPMAALYHLQLEQNERAESALRQAPVMIRHGARGFEGNTAIESGALVVDVTALLLAQQLGILDLVERQFGPLLISSWLPQSLTQQWQQAQPNQPALDSARQDVLKLVAEGYLHPVEEPWPEQTRADEVGARMGVEWCAWLERVKARNGLLVDFLPLTAKVGEHEIISLGDVGENERVISLGELLNGLRRAEVLTESDIQRCSEQLGHRARPNEREVDVSAGRLVFLEGIMVEQLAHAGSLRALCRHCRVEISRRSELWTRTEAERAKRQRELAQWLERLIAIVQQGVGAGRYRTFTHSGTGVADELTDDPTMLCLRDLIAQNEVVRRVTWCDDRFISRHTQTNVGPLLTTFEVLVALRERGALKSDEYFVHLGRLRRMGVRHLPVTTEEILHRLRAARSEHGRLIETNELAELRMAAAAAVRDTDRMQIPPPPQFNVDNSGELRWLLDLRNAVSSTLTEVWRESEIAVAIARADWLHEMLQFDLEVIIQLYLPAKVQALGTDAFLADTMRVLLAGVGLPSEHPNSRAAHGSKRRTFFRWLYHRIMRPAMQANPNFEAMLGARINGLLCDYLARLQSDNFTRRHAGLAVLLIFLDLPQELQQAVTPPASIREQFEVSGGEVVVGVRGQNFLPAVFWNAAAAAVNGRESRATSLSGEEWTFSPGDSGEFGVVICLRGPNEDTATAISIPLGPLLHDDAEIRRRFLRQHPEFCDLPVQERTAAIEEIVKQTDAVTRIEQVSERMAASAEWFYRELVGKISPSEAIDPEALLPTDCRSLLTHLRLEPGVPADWNAVAEHLLAEEGLETALLRLAVLPMRLPEPLRAAVRTLDRSAFDAIMDVIRPKMRTPVAGLHLFHLLAAQTVIDPNGLPRALEVRDELLAAATGRDSFEAFTAVLRWTTERFRQRPETSDWSVGALLAVAWSHAVRLHQLHIIGSVATKDVAARFEAARANTPTFLAAHPIGLLEDAAHPHRAEWSLFLSRGLGDVLSALPVEIAATLRMSSATLLAAVNADATTALPLIGLAQMTESRPNAMPSFLGGEWAAPLHALLGLEQFAAWFPYESEANVLEQLTELEGNHSAVGAWSILWGLVGDAPLPDSARDLSARLLNGVDLSALTKRLGDVALPALTFLCAQARYSGDSVLCHRMESQLLGVAMQLQGAWEERSGFGADDATFDEAAWRVAEAAFVLTSGAREDAETSFYKLATLLVQASPALGTVLRKRLGGRAPSLPFALARGVWPLYLALRSAR